MEEPSSSTPTEQVLSDAKEEDSVFLTQNNLPETNKQVGQKRKFTEISDGDFLKTKPKSKTETVCLETNEESDTLADFNTDTLVEECTLDWTENRLNTLHITSKLSSLIPVNKIISNYLHAIVTLGYFDGNPVATNLEKIVNSCIEMINIDSTPFKDIDVDDISDIKSSLAYSMIFSTPKFYVHGQEFTEQLIRLCLCQKNKKPIKEEMFEHLFRSFCSMFGLSSLKEANGETLKIGNTLVTAIPDIIFANFNKFNTENQNNKLNIMAVCKIKREFEENNLGSPSETRSQKQKSTKREKITKHIQHLNDKLLGQHGGELLVYLSQTQTDSMLGMVVHKTNVTFSYMQCTAEQLQKVQNGEHIEPLEITYSRCYNFLRTEDRKVLMKAFLSLGVTQLTPYV